MDRINKTYVVTISNSNGVPFVEVVRDFNRAMTMFYGNIGEYFLSCLQDCYNNEDNIKALNKELMTIAFENKPATEGCSNIIAKVFRPINSTEFEEMGGVLSFTWNGKLFTIQTAKEIG